MVIVKSTAGCRVRLPNWRHVQRQEMAATESRSGNWSASNLDARMIVTIIGVELASMIVPWFRPIVRFNRHRRRLTVPALMPNRQLGDKTGRDVGWRLSSANPNAG